MSEPRKEKENSIVKPDNLPPSVIKTNVNLSRLPFFALYREGIKKQLEREWVFAETRGDEHVELIWRVLATQRYGYPSSFAKKVHGAIEYLLTQNGFPVPEYLDFSLYEIANILGLKRIGNVYSGKIYSDIKNALFSITATSIESQGVFYYLDNGKRKSVHDMFHLYERVVFVGETLPDGTMAEKNRVYFGAWYLKSLNSLYIKPLDFPYWNSFKSDIARRLYEYLSFISFATKCKPFSIEYRRVCGFLPITPQKYFSQARQKMKKAHEELIKTGFLRKVAWRKSKTDSKKWIIVYYFGRRARFELQRGFKDDTYAPAILAVETAEIEEIEEIIEQGERNVQEKKSKRKKQTQEEEPLSPIAQELFNRGITKSVAIDFAENFSEEHLAEKIEMHDNKREIGEITTNAAGWLREAIVQDYRLSEQQLKKQAQLEKNKAQEEEQGILEEQAKEIQEQRITEALKDFPDSEQWVRERVVEHVKVREITIKSVGGEQFTEEEIKEMYLRYKAQVPKTDEEKRAWLISNYSEYALSTITGELREEQQKQQQEESKESDEPVLLNSIEDVLGEVARQRTEFGAKWESEEE